MDHLPRIGMRIVKTTLVVFVILLIFTAAGFERSPFYVLITAIICIQPDKAGGRSVAAKRVVSTLIGAFTGALVMLVQPTVAAWPLGPYLLDAVNAAMVCATIYLAVLLKREEMAFLACVAYLSVAVISRGTTDAYVFLFYRIVDTVLGVGIAYLVEKLRLPGPRRRDLLFAVDFDALLDDEDAQRAAFNMKEMNQFIGEGARVTVYTQEPTASFLERSGDLALNLPAVVLSGAALYDVADKRYLYTYPLPRIKSRAVQAFLEEGDYPFFTNVMVDSVLLIYCNDLADPVKAAYYESLRRSPYRNYVRRRARDDSEVLYFSVLDTPERLYALLDTLSLREKGLGYHLERDVFQGRSLLKIMNRDATPQRMIANLMEELPVSQAVRYGTDAASCDVVLAPGAFAALMKDLHRRYGGAARKRAGTGKDEGSAGQRGGPFRN